MMSESPRVASLDCNSVLSTFQLNVAWASSVLNVRSKAHVTRPRRIPLAASTWSEVWTRSNRDSSAVSVKPRCGRCGTGLVRHCVPIEQSMIRSQSSWSSGSIIPTGNVSVLLICRSIQGVYDCAAGSD